MSGPWEKYAAAETVPPAGPWEKYAGEAPALTLHVDPTAPMTPVSAQVPVEGAAPSMGLVDALARGIVRGDAGEGIKRGATSTLASGLHVATDALNQAMTPTNMLYGKNPLGLDTVADQSLEVENEINKDRQAAAERIGGQPGLADLMRNPSAGLEQGVAHLTNMGAESLPMMAAALATRNPELASALMGGTTGAQEYTDLRGQGVPRVKAAGAAGLTGAIETIGEGLALPTIMGKAGPGTLTRAILENAAQEAPVQIAQQAVEDQATGKQTSLAQQLRDALDAGLVGGALGAGGHVASNVPGLVQGMTGAPRVPAKVNAAAFSPIDATGNAPPPQAPTPSPAAAPPAAPTETPAPTNLDAMLDALLSGQASTPPAHVTEPAAAPDPAPAPTPTVQQAPRQPPEPPAAPKSEAPSAPAAEAPTENQTEGAILDLPMSSLTLSQDVPQFKSGAKENGVVEPLGGRFDERGVGPIQVWRRRDGRMEVISGRHRLDLARRSNKPTIKAQVYNEADGFDAKQAASLDAELNIRDGQGKVSDYVQYFKNAGIDQAEADARGLLARATGKRAFALATEGSEELLAAHSAGQLTDEAAVQIAKAAPGNERLQVLGMKSVQSGKSIAHAANLMRAVSAIAGDKPASQSDMFGLDDSAMHEAEQMAGVASREQRNITERLAAITGASKRPELARKEGIDVHNPEALQTRIRDLRLEKDGWDNWQTDPAKVAQIRDELGMGDIARAAEPEAEAEPEAPPQDDRTASMFAEEPAPRGGDMFGAATPQDYIRAATEARDAARNGKTGGRVDAGDGGLFDGPRPQQTDIEGEANRARANEPKMTDFADEPRQRSIARGNEDADRLGLRQAVSDALGPVADRVEYLHGYEGLPEKMRKGVESRNALGRKGVTAAMYSPDTGRVFIFTQVTKTPDRAVWHAAHEIAGHEGLRALLGDRLDPALNLARQNPTVKALADEIYSQRKIADQMKKSGRPPGDGFLLATEEALAELAAAVRTGNYEHINERYGVDVKPSMRESVKKAIANFLKRLKAMIDDIFGSHVFSDEDVRNLLEAAWQAAQNKGATASVQNPDGSSSLEQVVFHGTPHTVDKFSLQKIGTGEGAQAYGWGMYFASSKDIAEHYRRGLSTRDFINKARDAYDEYDSPDDAAHALRSIDGLSEPQKELLDALKADDWLGFDYPHQAISAALKQPQNFELSPETEAALAKQGNLYRVDVPEDHDLLDWDKPLSEQPDGVRGGIESLLNTANIARDQRGAWEQQLDVKLGALPRDDIGHGSTGKDLYRVLTNKLGSPNAASEALAAAGIPGLRYLDGTSRAKGEGSANYVIWDESAIGEPQNALDSTEDQTETPAFKRWFGDSKVVDADGKPLVVYHGTAEDFSHFVEPRSGKGLFFSPKPEIASEYAGYDPSGMFHSPKMGHVMPVYLSIKNPLVVDMQGSRSSVAGSVREAIEGGHDGVLLKNYDDVGGVQDQWVALNAAQIKSATGNRGTFDPESGNILESTDRDLVVTHNLSAEKLMHALRMGGLAVPSLAITRGDHALGSFGDITLVGKPELADPKRGAKAYGADIYSPRYPSITYKLDRSALKKLNAKLAPYQAVGREIYGGEISSIDDLIQDKAFKAYAAASGTDGGRYHDLKRIGADLLRKVGADEVLFQGYTNSGNRRYKPHTMANVVAALKKGLRGGESMNYGVGSLRAKFTPQFRSVDAIRKNKDRLISKQDFEKVKAEIDDELFKIVDALRAGSMRGNKFDFADTVLSVLEDAPRMGLARALESYDIHGVSDDVKQEMAGFLNKLKHLPAEYFEVKHLRSVGIGEFAAAVVPHDTSPEVVQALQDAGLDVTRYPSGDEQARREAVQSVANADDLLFSTEYTPEQKDFMRKAGMAGAVDERTAIKRALDGLRDKVPHPDADVFRQGAIDKFHGLKRAVDEKGGIAPEDNPYLAAEMIQTASTMEAILRFGAPELHQGALRVKRDVPGLLDALTPVRDQMPQWLGWMVARRAKVLKAQGRENAMTDADIAAGLSLADGHEQAFKEAALGYLKLKNAILDLAEQTGIIDPEARKAWDHAEYIPFYRDMDAGFSGPGTRQGLANQSSGIRTLKGGESPLKDPLGNIIANFTRLVDASMKNRATLLAVDQLGAPYFSKAPLAVKAETIPLDQVKKHLLEQGVDKATIAGMPADALKGVARMLAVKAPEGEDIVRVMRKGKAEYYHVDDPLLLRSLTAFNDGGTHWSLKPLVWFKQLLTAGATVTPDFLIRNALRDTGEASVTSKDRFVPVIDTVRGAIDSFRESELAQDLMMAGAAFHGGLFHTGNNEDTAKAIKRALRKHGLTDSAIERYVRTLINPKRLWDIYRSVSEATEMGSRVSLARKRLAAGATPVEAAHEAKDFLNFQRRGDDKFVQAFTKMIPFLNARLQGADRLYRVGTTKGRRGKVATRLAMMAMLTTLLYWWNQEEHKDAYDEIPDWDKDANWHIAPGTDHYLRIPKPFELGLVGGTVPERMYGALRYQLTNGEEGDRPAQSWDAFMRGLGSALGINPIPQAVMPIVEDIANKILYFDTPIESMGDRYKAPSDRFGPTTSPTMKAASKGMAALFGEDRTLSPKRLQHFWTGYTAGMGRYLLDGADWVTRKLEHAPEQPALALRDFPLVGTVARGGGPARSTRYVDEFYDLAEQAQVRSGAVKDALHNGDTARAARIEKEWGWLLGQREGSKRAKEGFMHGGLREINRVRDQLSAISKDNAKIYADRTMSGEAKRKALDANLEKRNVLVRKVVRQLREAERKSRG